MALRDLSGIGGVQDALTETNKHLAAVLRELQDTNNQRLEQVTKELRSVNEKLDRLQAPK
jgi:hypothetical protein